VANCTCCILQESEECVANCTCCTVQGSEECVAYCTCCIVQGSEECVANCTCCIVQEGGTVKITVVYLIAEMRVEVTVTVCRHESDTRDRFKI
jgi:hypothetical protein